MNKILVLSIVIIAVCSALPLDTSRNAQILRYENSIDPNNGYKYSFESSDGTIREETGTLITKDNGVLLVVQGSYSYFDDKGVKHDVAYIADDRGYRLKSETVVRPVQPEVFPVKDIPIPSVGVSQRIDPTVLGPLPEEGIPGPAITSFAAPRTRGGPPSSVSDRIDPSVLGSLIGGGI